MCWHHLLMTCSFSRQDYNSRIVGGSVTPTVWNILPQFPKLAVHTASFGYFLLWKIPGGPEVLLDICPFKPMLCFFPGGVPALYAVGNTKYASFFALILHISCSLSIKTIFIIPPNVEF